MLKLRNITIKQKLTLILMFTCLVVLLMAVTSIFAWDWIEKRQDMVSNLNSHAAIIADSSKTEIISADKQAATKILSALRTDPIIIYGCIYDKDDRILAEYQRGDITEKFQPPQPQSNKHTFQKHHLCLFRQIELDGEKIGCVYLLADLTQIRKDLIKDIKTSAVIAAIILSIAYFQSAFLQKIVSGPILNLAKVAKAVSEKKDYATRAVKKTNDELGLFIDTFNQMLEQIQRRDSALVDAKKQLEKRVRERTAELTTANKMLKTEVTERKKAEKDLEARVAELAQAREAALNMMNDAEQARQAAVQSERALRESEARYHRITDAMTDYIFTVKLENGKPVETIHNDISVAVTGYTPEEFAKDPDLWANMIHPDDRKAVYDQATRCIEGKEIEPLEHRIIRKDGAVRWTKNTLVRHLDAQVNLVSYDGLLQDITEKRQAEEKLRQIQAAVDDATNAIVITDREAKILYANMAFNKLFGYPSKTANNTSVKPVFVNQKMIKQISQSVLNMQNFEGEVEMVTTQKQTFPAFLHATPRTDERENVLGMLLIITNITERKRAEEELRKAKEQTEKSKEQVEKINVQLESTYNKLMKASHQAGMTEVATDVLHNVGNVLNSVNVSATLITEKIMNSEVTNLEKLAEMIGQHGDDISTFLTKDPKGKLIPTYLSEVSKQLINEHNEIIEKLQSLIKNIEHIKEIVKMQQMYARASGVEISTTLEEIIEDAIQINHVGFERHKIKLTKECQELGDITIDRQKVLQILVNLISNANYALKNRKNKQKSLNIKLYKHGENRIRIQVTDTGIGIPKENIKEIFRHGFTTKKHGHGFGLHSCALAAKEMGGSLTARSNGPGKGATFILELPLKPAETAKCLT